MFNTIAKYTLILFIFLNFSCASVPSAQQSPQAVTPADSRPVWVSNRYSEFDRSRYIAEVGAASTREMAESQALANIARQFETSISADQTLVNNYQEFVRNGMTSWSENTTNQEIIRTASNIDFLVGTEIRAVWHDTRTNTFHAVAVMEKARAIPVYMEIIQANFDLINNLTTMSQQEKNTLEGYSRYWYAGVIADMNRTYANIVTLLGTAPTQSIVSGNNYRLEAQNILRNIPIEITVINDSNRRIQNAFSAAVSDLGFRTGGNNSRYKLEVNVITTPRPSRDGFEQAYIDISANIIDRQTNAVLFPYSFPSPYHEGHRTYSEAVNRCYNTAVEIINNGDDTKNPPLLSYSQYLRDYLSHFISGR